MERAFETYVDIDTQLRELIDLQQHAEVERWILHYAVNNPRFPLSVAVQIAQKYVLSAESVCCGGGDDSTSAGELPLIRSSLAWLTCGFEPRTGATTFSALDRGVEMTFLTAEDVRPREGHVVDLAALKPDCQRSARLRQADPVPGAPDYRHLGPGLDSRARELLAQLWRLGVYVDVSADLPDSVLSEVRTNSERPGNTEPRPTDRAEEARYLILLHPEVEDILPTVLSALTRICAAHLPVADVEGQLLPPLQPWLFESVLSVYLVAARLGLPDYDDHWLEDYLYGPLVPATGSVRWPVVFAVAECMEAVLRGEEDSWRFHGPVSLTERSAGTEVSGDNELARRTFHDRQLHEIGDYVGMALNLWPGAEERSAATRLMAETVAGNPQLAPQHAALLGAQLAELTGRDGRLLDLSEEDVVEIARGTWFSALEWEVNGYAPRPHSVGLELGDGTILFRDCDVTPVSQEPTAPASPAPEAAAWASQIEISAERLAWGKRLVASPESLDAYRSWRRYGLSDQALGYLNNLWRIGMRVLPPHPLPGGELFLGIARRGGRSDPAAPPADPAPGNLVPGAAHRGGLPGHFLHRRGRRHRALPQPVPQDLA